MRLHNQQPKATTSLLCQTSTAQWKKGSCRASCPACLCAARTTPPSVCKKKRKKKNLRIGKTAKLHRFLCGTCTLCAFARATSVHRLRFHGQRTFYARIGGVRARFTSPESFPYVSCWRPRSPFGTGRLDRVCLPVGG